MGLLRLHPSTLKVATADDDSSLSLTVSNTSQLSCFITQHNELCVCACGFSAVCNPDNRSLSFTPSHSLSCHISTPYPDWLVGFICCVSVLAGTHHRNAIGIFAFYFVFYLFLSRRSARTHPCCSFLAPCRRDVSRGHKHAPLSGRVSFWLVTTDCGVSKKQKRRSGRVGELRFNYCVAMGGDKVDWESLCPVRVCVCCCFFFSLVCFVFFSSGAIRGGRANDWERRSRRRVEKEQRAVLRGWWRAAKCQSIAALCLRLTMKDTDFFFLFFLV